MSSLLSPLQYRFSAPTATAQLKQQPEDFVVCESLGFDFSGSGEHFMVHVRKTGENTSYVANELGKFCGVKSRDVSWAGLKDRHAVTEQWLSVHLPGKADPDLTEFVSTHPGIEILATARHDKKLRPGDLIGNRFVLRLRDVSNLPEVLARLPMLSQGVPNYFGAQRFGHDGNNVEQARAWGKGDIRVKDKNKRSFYLSAARSWLFNQILSKRLADNTVQVPMLGDWLESADDTRGWALTEINDAVQARIATGEWAITGAMVGDNALPCTDAAAEMEWAILNEEPDLLKLVRDNRMRQDRRALLLFPQDLTWEQDGNDLVLSFGLPAGAFATALVRELIDTVEETI